MPRLAKSRRASQLPLFQPTSAAPRWESLPREVRGQAVALLADLLRDLVHGDPRELGGEVRDE
jgi:hypothetical protein